MSDALSGAASGAAAGSIVPGWGTAIGAGIGLLGSLMGSGAASANAAQQKAIALAQLKNAQNEQGYQHGLNAEALRRAIAGSTDAQGSSIRYDPATNSWVSTLGKVPQQIQGAENAATLLRNNVEVPLAAQNNAAQSIQASLARRGMSGAVNNLNNYTPITGAGEYGALQDAATRANQISQAPVIQDTLRQFARTGTAAGPVLAQLERANTDSLAQEMDRNVVQSQTDAANVNSARQQSLTQPIAALTAAGTPSMGYAPMTGTNPAAALAAQVNGRATGSASPATMGAAYNAYGTGATNNAATSAITNADRNATPAIWGSIGNQAGTLFKDVTAKDAQGNSIGGQILNWGKGLFGTSGDNNYADQKLYPQQET